jgi:hypothetical protein
MFVPSWHSVLMARTGAISRALCHSTSRSTLRIFIRSSACTTSLLLSTTSRRSTVRVASRCPGSTYSPRMRLASSTARRTVSWSGLFITVHNSRTGIQADARGFVPAKKPHSGYFGNSIRPAIQPVFADFNGPLDQSFLDMLAPRTFERAYLGRVRARFDARQHHAAVTFRAT